MRGPAGGTCLGLDDDGREKEREAGRGGGGNTGAEDVKEKPKRVKRKVQGETERLAVNVRQKGRREAAEGTRRVVGVQEGLKRQQKGAREFQKCTKGG